MRTSTLASLVVALGITSPALAQPAELASVDRRPPALFIAPNPQTPAERLAPKSVDIAVKIVGRLAETRLTLTFGNPYARALAGDLYVPLPEHATISGYALDVQGNLVDGVVVPKDEARRIFEKEVRKGVDPGLVEWTKGNVFKTRVFPVPANGSRTIMVRWVAPLDEDATTAWLDLPLAFSEPVDAKVRVEIERGKERPVVTGAGPLKLAFDDRLVAEVALAHQKLVQNLRIALPDVARRPVQVERDPAGDTWFSIAEVVPAPAASPLTPHRLRVVWDASLSRQGADRAREAALIAKLLDDRFAAAEVEVTVLRHEASPVKVFPPASGKAVKAYLDAVACDGGTQLARLGSAPGGTPVDLVLVVSDGLSTFGDEDPGPLGAPTWVLSSSIEAAHDALAHLAQKNGGAYYNLARATDAEVTAAIGRPVFSLLEARVLQGDVKDLLPGGTEPVRGASFVAGRLASASATLQVAYGVPGEAAAVTKSYEVRAADAAPGDIVSRAWAERKLSALMASPQRNADAILALGKAHGIVTPGTSLLVLEALDQYVQYRVRPPATLPEMRKAWDAQIEEEEVARKKTEAERLDEVAAWWGEESTWYEQKFEYPKGFRVPREATGGEAFGMGMGGGGVAMGSASVAAPPAPRAVSRDLVELEDAAPEPAAKTDAAEAKPKDKPDVVEEEPVEPGVAMTPWDPQTPYIKALKKASPGERVAVYLAQRGEFGQAPSFYLDVADFFLAQKDRTMALQVLSNIAELKLEDAPLLRVLGHRLEQLDELALAQRTFEEVLRLRPEEPQSDRDLALVLARRAKAMTSPDAARAAYQRAMDLLADVVKQRWDRFERIEIIALTELNRIWLDAKAAGCPRFPLDQRFEKPMELDLRIAMTWDADMTDMDLHVLEPSGEEAFYSNNLTTIGGHVSRDFTQGYGPEVYAIRKAMHGTYKVKTKFYGSSAAELQGAVTLQVDVFTNWGRPNEKRRAMTLRLTETKEDFLVGEIEF